MSKPTATVTIAAIELTCPHCDETIPAPGGSHLITEDDLERMTEAGRLWCPICGEYSKAPAWPTRKRRTALA